MKLIGLVALGSALGGCLRYAVQNLGLVFWPHFPLGTVAVNLTGAFLAGVMIPFLPTLPDPWRFFLLTGFLGGLTTLSSFALDFVLLTDQKRLMGAAAYWAASAIGAILCCVVGMVVGRSIS